MSEAEAPPIVQCDKCRQHFTSHYFSNEDKTKSWCAPCYVINLADRIESLEQWKSRCEERTLKEMKIEEGESQSPP